jgi:hypothetical protein
VADPITRGLPGPLASELAECIVHEAGHMADLTIRFLDDTGLFPPEQRRERPVALPAELLLELAAVLRIAIWERDGLLDPVAVGLPHARDAYDELMERAAHRPDSFSSVVISPPLHRKVMWVVLRQLAWNGRRDLGADVVLGRTDGDGEAELEAMAEFLWARRHPASGRPLKVREAGHGQG